MTHTSGASHYWLKPAFRPAGWDCASMARPAKSRQQARLPAPQSRTSATRVPSLSEKPYRYDWQSSRSLSSCPTRQPSRNQRLILSQEPEQGRLEIGPQVTNLPHKPADNRWTSIRRQGPKLEPARRPAAERELRPTRPRKSSQ